MVVEKYPHLPQATPDHHHLLDDRDFDMEVDRDPYAGRRPGSEPKLGRGLWIATAIILVGTVVVLGITAIFLW